MAETTNRYILLPREGTRARQGPAMQMLVSLPTAHSTTEPQLGSLPLAFAPGVTVIDTLAEDGAKLVELDDQTAAAVNSADSPLRAVPVVTYSRPDQPLRPLGGPTALPAAGATASVSCADQATGAPIADVHIVAFTNFDQRIGAEGNTDAQGHVTLQLASAAIERLYAYPLPGYWGVFRRSLTAGPIALTFESVDLNAIDCVRYYYKNSQFDSTTGVTVGVIDTGVGPHNDVHVAGGYNAVTGEAKDDFADVAGHGTHVAGLIGANGAPPTGLRGLAPGVTLRAYRVFPQTGGATNYAILKAMILAAADGCDLINLSLGGGPYDEIVAEAITDARNAGMLIVIAAGNDGRKPVSYPAAYPGATAISAMGREGTFPAGSLDEGNVLRPPTSSPEPLEFIASFSNIGPQVALTGPGVGAVSTLPHDHFGPMSGTSMAAPVVTGAAACLLSRDAVLFSMPRNAARAQAIEKMLQTQSVRRQFGPIYEGYGLPDPATV